MAKSKTSKVAKAEPEKKVDFKAGKSTYKVLERYAQLPNLSAVFRAMSADGWKRADIAKSTGALYQHVRNVLTQPVKRPS